MNIDHLEKNIHRIVEPASQEIIELIIDSVRSYPVYNLLDTDEFFNNIKSIIKSDEINLENLKAYINSVSEYQTENEFWIIDSLNTLVESFELMKLKNITFIEIRNILDSLDK